MGRAASTKSTLRILCPAAPAAYFCVYRRHAQEPAAPDRESFRGEHAPGTRHHAGRPRGERRLSSLPAVDARPLPSPEELARLVSYVFETMLTLPCHLIRDLSLKTAVAGLSW